MTEEVWYTCQQPLLFGPSYIMARYMRVDHLVILEEAQFDRWHVQFKMGGKGGDMLGTVPLNKAKRQPFHEITVTNLSQWLNKLDKQVRHMYGGQEPFRAVEDLWKSFLKIAESADPNRPLPLSRLCHMSMVFAGIALRETTGWTPYANLSIHDCRTLVDERPDDASDWMEALGKEFGATDYIQGGKSITEYFKPDTMKDLRVWGSEFYKTYKGVGGVEHDATYSILDLLFTQSPEQLVDFFDLDDMSKQLHGVRYVPTSDGYKRHGD